MAKPSGIGPRILELREEGKSYNEIVTILGCSKSSVCYHLGKDQKNKSLDRQRILRKENPLMKKIQFFRQSYIPPLEQKINKRDIEEVLYYKLYGFNRDKNRNKSMKNTLFTSIDLIYKIGDHPSCYLTGDPIDLSDGSAYQLDHIIPVSRGGDNTLENCGLASKIANQSKGALTVDEYLALCEQVLLHHGYKIKRPN